MPRCERCGGFLDPLARGTVVCGDCRIRRRDPLDLARAAVPYEGLARELVHRLKYHRKRRAAVAMGELFDLWLSEDAASDAVLAFGDAEALVPVPLHFTRRWQRGFNQAELLGERLAARVERPLLPLLVRTRRTRPQVGLGVEERRRNVAGAFAAVPERVVKGAYYVLVDDVFTSGATLRECAAALRRAGAGRISAVTVARRVEPDFVIKSPKETADP